jgi:hypothetical protein
MIMWHAVQAILMVTAVLAAVAGTGLGAWLFDEWQAGRFRRWPIRPRRRPASGAVRVVRVANTAPAASRRRYLDGSELPAPANAGVTNALAPDSDGWIAPAWVGEFPHPAGLQQVEREDIELIVANVAAEAARAGADWVGVPFFVGHPYDQGAAPAVAWAKDVRVRDGRLEFRPEWTPEGRRLVDDRAFKFTSVCWDCTADPLSGNLHPYWVDHVALTNSPNIRGQKPLANTADVGLADPAEPSDPTPAPAAQPPAVAPTQPAPAANAAPAILSPELVAELASLRQTVAALQQVLNTALAAPAALAATVAPRAPAEAPNANAAVRPPAPPACARREPPPPPSSPLAGVSLPNALPAPAAGEAREPGAGATDQLSRVVNAARRRQAETGCDWGTANAWAWTRENAHQLA